MKNGMAILMAVALASAAAGQTWRPQERWRGFNLTGMFIMGHSEGYFLESDFRQIREFGFNFVRLPLDYRYWIVDGDWEKIDEAKLAPLDEAVTFGRRHGLHVQIAFHRAPGYTVARPPETRDLFSDPEALRVCAMHWAFFARRYRDIPNEALSFNLFNEPNDQVTEEAYERVATALVAAIRAESPDRLIIADGLAWGARPAQNLFKLGIGQAMRGYRPMSVSHYLASWVGTPTAEPVWPPTSAVSPLYGPAKAPWNVPLILENLPAGRLTLMPSMVSGPVTLRAEADGVTLAEHALDPKPGPGWTNVVFRSEWGIHQGQSLTPLEVVLKQPVQRLAISIPTGDWAGLARVTLTGADDRVAALHLVQTWGETNTVLRFQGFGAMPPFRPAGAFLTGEDHVRRDSIAPWQPAFDAGILVMVGEFGAYRHTPHGLVLTWLEDQLRVWKSLGMGWALWNYRGAFGVMDSGRADVTYEEFQGRNLDRKMLELLMRY